MRAIEFDAYGPASVLRVAQVEAPHAGAGEIRISVRASGISSGDVLIRSGAWRDRVAATFPYRTGFDAAGIVDEVGTGVTDVAVGDEVFGMTDAATRGANADFAVLAGWAPKPHRWTWEQTGGAAGAIETANRVFDRLDVGAGDTVLIQGASGGVGVMAVQLAVERGARVIGTASESNHEFLRSLGAEPTTYGPGLVERVRVLAPRGVDAVLDSAGGSLPDLISIAGDPSRVVTIVDFTAASLGVHFSRGVDPDAVNGLVRAVSLANEGRLQSPVAASFRLEQVAAAHVLSESRHAPGKIVLVH